MKFNQRDLVPALMMAVLMVGCGTSTDDPPVIPPTTPPPTTCTGLNCPPGQSPTDPNFPPGTVPAYAWTFNLDENNGFKFVSPSMQTDSILRVQISSGLGANNTRQGFQNYGTNYGCVSYRVAMRTSDSSGSGGTQNGQSVQSQMLSVAGSSNYLCPNSPSSQVIEFSPRLSRSDRSFSIEIASPRYDYYCQLWWSYYQYGGSRSAESTVGPYGSACPLRTVFPHHAISGSIAVQVNGTQITP